MSAILHFLQLKLGTMGNNLTLMLDIGMQHSLKSKLTRRFIYNGYHIEVISNLKIGLFQ
ncbi:hypothetical protein D3C81_1882730 [compost metagenome]